MHEVWTRLGDVDNFVDPFMGSLAPILCRPDWHKCKAETVNDLDSYISNFWRALKAAPESVAEFADWPVNETDLTARHLWLINQGRERLAKFETDPDLYDAKVAGYWVWGINAWIGSGWCSGTGCWNVDDKGNLVDVNENGVNKKLPHLGDRGQGINRGGDTNLTDLTAYLQALATRLRGVRVCCGDWKRVVTNGALSYGETVGVFLDPPYDQSIRDNTLYSHESPVSDAVREWALTNGGNPRYRIALCGYEGEHAMPDSWEVLEWKANASYQSANSDGANQANRKKERVWFSPNCINPKLQESLFSQDNR